jgi:hypothetical protein
LFLSLLHQGDVSTTIRNIEARNKPYVNHSSFLPSLSSSPSAASKSSTSAHKTHVISAVNDAPSQPLTPQQVAAKRASRMQAQQNAHVHLTSSKFNGGFGNDTPQPPPPPPPPPPVSYAPGDAVGDTDALLPASSVNSANHRIDGTNPVTDTDTGTDLNMGAGAGAAKHDERIAALLRKRRVGSDSDNNNGKDNDNDKRGGSNKINFDAISPVRQSSLGASSPPMTSRDISHLLGG